MATTNPDEAGLYINGTSAPTNNVANDLPTNSQPTSTHTNATNEPTTNLPEPTYPNTIPTDEPNSNLPKPTYPDPFYKLIHFPTTPINTDVVIKQPSSSPSTPTNTDAFSKLSNFKPAPAGSNTTPTNTDAFPKLSNFKPAPAGSNTTPTNTNAFPKLPDFEPTPAGPDTTPPKPEDVVLMDELKKLEEQITDKEVASIFAKLAAYTLCCGTSCVLGCFAIVAIIPLLQLIIGLRHAGECPVNQRIPHYLVVAGACGLASIGLSILQIVLRISGIFQEDKASAAVKYAAKGLSAVSLALDIFTIVWFIAGCVWIFSAWRKVQYVNPDQSNYCQSTLYRFAFWLILISVIYHAVIWCSTCTRLSPKTTPKRKGQHIAVPTTEP